MPLSFAQPAGVVGAAAAAMKAGEKQLREQLGRELRKARLARGLTQADVAERVDTDPETISRFERGATLPSLTRLLDLAEALHVTVGSLVGAASSRTTDELDDVLRSVTALPLKERKLATALLRAVVETLAT